MSAFRPGITQIITRTPVPVIPMALTGLWGSILSRKDGAAFSKPWKARPFRKIVLKVGAPVLAEKVTLQGLQEEVGKLLAD